MCRLDAVCKKSTGSVPRNRVFSHYATRCGTERVPPLNPASFGKLVRIIYPGIQTRRLGMRGESKYHYVELSLVDEQQAHMDIERRQTVRELSVAPDRPNLKRYVSVARR
jgi:regulatory factor X